MARLFVSNKDESPRMFKSDFLDLFSRVHWSVPLIVWVPVVSYCIYHSVAVYQLPVLNMVGLYFLAMLTWTLAEYILHRFVFHFHPSSKLGQRIHFIAHGVHHDFPNDSKRLVMPPPLAIPLAGFFFGLFWLIMQPYHLIFFAGFVSGYLLYDMTHYAVHHAGWNNPVFRKLKEYHMLHHFQEPEKAFGVSSPFWDYVFGTPLKIEKKQRTSAGEH